MQVTNPKRLPSDYIRSPIGLVASTLAQKTSRITNKRATSSRTPPAPSLKTISTASSTICPVAGIHAVCSSSVWGSTLPVLRGSGCQRMTSQSTDGATVPCRGPLQPASGRSWRLCPSRRFEADPPPLELDANTADVCFNFGFGGNEGLTGGQSHKSGRSRPRPWSS